MCFVPGDLLLAGNSLFPYAVNLNWVDKLAAPYHGGKMPPLSGGRLTCFFGTCRQGML